MAKKVVFTSVCPPWELFDDPRGEWRRRIRDYGHIVRHPLSRNEGDDVDPVEDQEAMTDN